MRRSTIFLILLALTAGLPTAAGNESPEFDTAIAPILASHCLDCHSGPEPKGGLDLSHSASAKAGGESGPGLAPGKLDESHVWLRVEAGEMPPKKPLPERERKLLQAWILSGAKWGTDPIDPFRFSTETRGGYDWWSLQPLTQPTLHASVGNPQLRNPIDAFVLERLHSAGLEPSLPADRRTLIRRLYFDLLGLPPAQEAILEFQNDSAPDAYERLVDRVLASPHYGERWARHWLDIARFGESDGFEFDRMRSQAWRYRDWVISAFNRDLPYDEFARQQIAGDTLPQSGESSLGVGLAAVGFLVAGAYDGLVPQGESMRAIMRHDELEDVVGTVSQTFLGLTVHCARCHDHKFDPISQIDYYRLESALAGVRRGERGLENEISPSWLTARRNQTSESLESLEQRAKQAVIAKRGASRRNPSDPPKPIARWSFDDDASDDIGGLDLELQGGAKIDGGRLILDGKTAFASSPPLVVDLEEKTLEVWVQLSDLTQRAGGALSVETLNGDTFDSIVFAERTAGHWLPGSDFFRRTQELRAAAEIEADKQVVHLAMAYHADGRIAVYRNGLPYGEPYASNGPIKFKAGESHVVLGLRHSPFAEGRLLSGSIERAQLYDRALSAGEVAASAGVESSHVTEAELSAELTAEEKDRRSRLKLQLVALNDQVDRWNESKVFTLTPQQPAATHLLLRGNPQQKGDVIQPGSLSALAKTAASFELAADAPEAHRRVKLAGWIASPGNPLFARTMANRLWHYHFGRGLVDTPNDLGFSGGEPSNPQLLDWLAAELVRRQFSLKEMHRLLVCSATYQQQSLPRADALSVDADNRLLWRMSPRRLDAESLRDSMLAISGELNSRLGGPSIHDFRAFNRAGTQFYEPQDLSGPEYHRRTIYRMWARGGKSPLLETFDCPDPSTTSPKRSVTTTPLQALSLLNSEFTLRMADSMAAELQRQHPDNIEQQLTTAFERACGRKPSPIELSPSVAFVQEHGLPAFCRVLFNSNAFLYVD